MKGIGRILAIAIIGALLAMSALGSSGTLAPTRGQVITGTSFATASEAIPVRAPAVSTSWEDLTDTGLVGVAFCVVELPDGGYRGYYMGGGGMVSALSTDGVNWTPEEGQRLSPIGGDEWMVTNPWVFLTTDSRFRMIYEGQDEIGNRRFFSAISSDGLEFTREGMVMAGDEEDLAPVGGTVFLSVPDGVRLSDSSLRMYFVSSGDCIRSARSTDEGLTWTRDDGMRLPAAVDPAILLLPNGNYRMLYTDWIEESRLKRILYANSADGLEFTPVEETVVEVSDPAYMVMDPEVIYDENGRVRLFFSYPDLAGAPIYTCLAPSGWESNLSSSLQVNFGDIPSGVFPLDKGIKHRFTIKNIGDSELIVPFKVEEAGTGAEINSWPQPQTLYLSPGEEQWLVIPFLYDPNIEQLIEEYGLGEHTYSLNYIFQDYYDSTDTMTVTQDYTFTILNPENITGDFTVQGTVVDENSQPIQGAEVLLTTGNYQTRFVTSGDGSFSFSVPHSPKWWLKASKEGYKNAYAFDLTETPYTLTLLPFTEEIPQYECTKQVTTDMGFWKYVVDADEQYILLSPGMENWVDPTLKNQSKLMLYTLDDEKIWEYPIGWEAWGADLSQDAKYAVYVTQNKGEPGLVEDEMGLLDAQTGDILWRKDLTYENFPTDSPYISAGWHQSKEVQFSHNNVYIGIGMGWGDFFLLDRETGNILWSYFTEGQVRKIIFTIDDDFVYVGSGDGRLYKFATSDGTLQWMTHIWAWPYTYGLALSPDESLIAACVKTGEVSVVGTSDGTRLWDYDLGIMCVRWVQFSPDGTMLAAGSGTPGGTTIFDATDGTPLWRTGYSASGMFTADGDNVFIGEGTGQLFTQDGTLITDEIDPGFEGIARAYWKVAYISQDKSRIVLAARDMEPSSIGIAFFEKVSNIAPGDANGDGNINALDITKVERIIAGLDAETPGADANQDGNINALDITKIERIIAGLD